jgi:hypothetical protein
MKKSDVEKMVGPKQEIWMSGKMSGAYPDNLTFRETLCHPSPSKLFKIRLVGGVVF